ncbi:grasp-with-spasm system ATP-grasp peptide maturase [Flavobacteriaceae bacterium]|nr:grasp-with-spasm system ATP-grasp peptide maturase [Flavobacteriaceae bacterium]
MILILSRESAELTTDNVIDWLQYRKSPFYRLNGEDLFNGNVTIEFELKNSQWEFHLKEKGCKISSRTIKAVWFRRAFNPNLKGRIQFETNNLHEYKSIENLNNYHTNELRIVYSLFEQSLKHSFWLNRPSDVSNKFKILQEAQALGIKTPNSFLTNNKTSLSRFLTKNPTSITKSCGNGGSFEFGKNFISGLTARVQQKDIINCSHDIFFPSLFQEEIGKKYEVRVFYLIGKIFSVGIFSQSNEDTAVDYRNYDYNKPNRMEIIDIPKGLKNKITTLMKRLKINCGSLDFIKSLNDEYYFLEVNPVGQFLGISEIGNLKLDKLLAEVLIKNEKKEIKYS